MSGSPAVLPEARQLPRLCSTNTIAGLPVAATGWTTYPSLIHNKNEYSIYRYSYLLCIEAVFSIIYQWVKFTMSLRRFDLNLLSVFDVLIEEQSVTRSAERLAMSQPAVSHALSRLRRQLDDPILIKSGDRMKVSPRALQIHAETHEALKQIKRAISPQPRFDPTSSKRQFNIASTDHVESLILPKLISHLEQRAPGIELNVHHLAANLPLEDLEKGTIDLAIARSVRTAKRFECQFLLEDGYLCAVAQGHPASREQLTMEKYMSLDHLVVAPAKYRSQYNKKLFEGLGTTPRVVANMQHFLAALHATSESSVIITGPALLLRKFHKAFGLHLIEPPFDLPPTRIDLVWHQFKSNDPGVEWLRSQLSRIAGALRG